MYHVFIKVSFPQLSPLLLVMFKQPENVLDSNRLMTWYTHAVLACLDYSHDKWTRQAEAPATESPEDGLATSY